MDLNEIGRRLKLVRKDKGLTMSEVYGHTGIAVETLSRYENGRKGMQLSTFLRLCKFYQCSSDYLLSLK